MNNNYIIVTCSKYEIFASYIAALRLIILKASLLYFVIGANSIVNGIGITLASFKADSFMLQNGPLTPVLFKEWIQYIQHEQRKG